MQHSFYGGPKGDSFIITKTFECDRMYQRTESGQDVETSLFKYVYNIHVKEFGSVIKEAEKKRLCSLKYSMAEAFKQGNLYTEVQYGEYVLIQAPSSNEEAHGKIFRRGYDFNNGWGGAEYIGKFTGPRGKTPKLILKKSAESIVAEDGTPQFEPIDGYEYKLVEPQSIEISTPLSWEGTRGNTQKEYPYIKAGYVQLSDPIGSDSVGQLGFTVPQIVFDTTLDTEPYDENGVRYNFTDSSHQGEKKDPLIFKHKKTKRSNGTKDNPFAYDIDFWIPKGIHGTSINSIFIQPETAGASDYNKYEVVEFSKDKLLTTEQCNSYVPELFTISTLNYDIEKNGMPSKTIFPNFKFFKGIYIDTAAAEKKANNQQPTKQEIEDLGKIKIMLSDGELYWTGLYEDYKVGTLISQYYSEEELKRAYFQKIGQPESPIFNHVSALNTLYPYGIPGVPTQPGGGKIIGVHIMGEDASIIDTLLYGYNYGQKYSDPDATDGEYAISDTAYTWFCLGSIRGQLEGQGRHLMLENNETNKYMLFEYPKEYPNDPYQITTEDNTTINVLNKDMFFFWEEDTYKYYDNY